MLWIGVALATSACATGRLFEAGRLRESVVAYRSASTDGEALRVDYVVEVRDRDRKPLGRELRGASLRLADLRARPELRVDAFPMEAIGVADASRRGFTPLPVALAEPEMEVRPVVGRGPVCTLEVVARNGRHAGFRLRSCGGDPADPPRFDSAALYRDRTAWWVYPLLPLSVLIDAALFPPQVVLLVPLWVIGD